MKSETSQTPPTQPAPAPPDDVLTDMAIDFVLAMMGSASTDVIDPREWWTRARTGLESSASATSWPEMVSRYGAKLQVVALRDRSASQIATLGAALGSQGGFRRFRALCRRDALFITAMAQQKRAEQKADRYVIDAHEGQKEETK